MMLTCSNSLFTEILRYYKEAEWKIFNSLISYIYGLLHHDVSATNRKKRPLLVYNRSILNDANVYVLPHTDSLMTCTFLTMPRGCRFPAEQHEVSEKFLWKMEP